MERLYVEQCHYPDLTRYLPLKVATAIWLLFALATCAYGLAATWSEWWPYQQLGITDLAALKPVIYATLAGTLGATVYAIRGFYWSVGPQRTDVRKYLYDPNFVWWYLFRPFLGAALGGAVYAFVRGGVTTFGGGTTAEGSTAAFFAVSFLAGFASHELLSWITAMGERLFHTPTAPPTSRPKDIELNTPEQRAAVNLARSARDQGEPN